MNAKLSCLLFDFDNTTGVVSNLQTLDRFLYGTTFSPNSNLLYACSSTDVFQYDILIDFYPFFF